MEGKAQKTIFQSAKQMEVLLWLAVNNNFLV